MRSSRALGPEPKNPEHQLLNMFWWSWRLKASRNPKDCAGKNRLASLIRWLLADEDTDEVFLRFSKNSSNNTDGDNNHEDDNDYSDDTDNHDNKNNNNQQPAATSNQQPATSKQQAATDKQQQATSN